MEMEIGTYQIRHRGKYSSVRTRIREFIRFWVRMCGIAGAIITGLAIAYVVGISSADTIVAKNEIIVQTEVEKKAAVMERICKAESGCQHSKDGKVIVATNQNGSHDIGKYQINFEIWGMDAMQQGINLFDEADNEKFAYWLYDTYGTEPWNNSRHNW